MENKIYKSFNSLGPDVYKLFEEAFKNPGPHVKTLKEITTDLEYKDEYDFIYKPNVHMEFRKNFINDLHFLNTFVKFVENTKRKYFVIYIGDTHHIYELARYYPNVTFICTGNETLTEDNWTHNLNSIENLGKLLPSNIRIFNIKNKCDLGMLISIKEELPQEHILFLISNTKHNTIDYNNNEDSFQKELRKEVYQQYQSDYAFISDICNLYNWIRILYFNACMINFRIPNDNDKKEIIELFSDDILENQELEMLESYQNGNLKFMVGSLLLQAWGPKSSSETKLIIKKKNIENLALYNGLEYNGLINYYNSIERFVRNHKNNTNGYCECNDCSIEISTIKEYLLHNNTHVTHEFGLSSKYKLEDMVWFISTRISKVTFSSLNLPNHGLLYKSPNFMV